MGIVCLRRMSGPLREATIDGRLGVINYDFLALLRAQLDSGGPFVRPSTAAGVLAIAATLLGASGKAFAQGSTCSSWYDACYQKSVGGMAPAKAKSDCNLAIRRCKQTGCFVGPHSGTTFACNLAKQ